jgi:hypothetical protein
MPYFYEILMSIITYVYPKNVAREGRWYVRNTCNYGVKKQEKEGGTSETSPATSENGSAGRSYTRKTGNCRQETEDEDRRYIRNASKYSLDRIFIS